MAHGFHFFKGAPKKNWLMFYPVEWLFSWVTDTLITINKEDYCLAHKHFHAKHIAYVPGVGIDTAKFFVDAEAVKITRKKLGMGEDNILLLSVGEVNDNKNHIIVIQALAKLKNEKIHYFICGVGDKTNQLKMLAQKEGIGHQVHFLGFREDIRELCSAADLFIFPSKREGLPVSLMEAIACHVPVLCSRVRGNVDLVKNEKCLFDSTDVESVIKCLQYSLGDGSRANILKKMTDSINTNYNNLQKYTIDETEKKIQEVYVNKFQ